MRRNGWRKIYSSVWLVQDVEGQDNNPERNVILALRRRMADIPPLWVEEEIKEKPCINVISIFAVIKKSF